MEGISTRQFLNVMLLDELFLLRGEIDDEIRRRTGRDPDEVLERMADLLAPVSS